MTGKFSRLMLVAASTLAVVACGSGESDAKNAGKAGQAAGTSAATRDWSTNVVATPEGGYRMGNPDARVKLVEYASLWCTHCRDFALQSKDALVGNYVKSGQVSYEFRPFIIAFPDYIGFLTAKCQPASQFFTWSDQMYRNHAAWTLPFTKIPQATLQQVQSLPADQQLTRLAELSGFDAFVRLRGVPKAKLDQCLRDKAAMDRLNATAQAGQDQFQITGTPTFIVNGEKAAGVADWASLEPKIKELL